MIKAAVLLRRYRAGMAVRTIRAGLAAVSQYEQEHGMFTAQELDDADQWAARVTGGPAPAGQQRGA